ncbi:hypothetical protein H0H93_002042, partial [Arthromyces matolae]
MPLTRKSWYQTRLLGDPYAWNAEKVLELGAPYSQREAERRPIRGKRFEVEVDHNDPSGKTYVIHDRLLEFKTRIPANRLNEPLFDITNWYQDRLESAYRGMEESFNPAEDVQGLTEDMEHGIREVPLSQMYEDLESILMAIRARERIRVEEDGDVIRVLELNGQQ